MTCGGSVGTFLVYIYTSKLGGRNNCILLQCLKFLETSELRPHFALMSDHIRTLYIVKFRNWVYHNSNSYCCTSKNNQVRCETICVPHTLLINVILSWIVSLL